LPHRPPFSSSFELAANSKFVDQHTSPEEDFPSADRSHRSVGKVEKLVTSAPPPLSTIGYSVDVADGNEVPPPEKKGILIFVAARETMNLFLMRAYKCACFLH
jgi:hypothetical protein